MEGTISAACGTSASPLSSAVAVWLALHGFVLGAVNRGAYPDLPHEVQLLWYKSVAIGL
jgi:hypothetical protein